MLWLGRCNITPLYEDVQWPDTAIIRSLLPKSSYIGTFCAYMQSRTFARNRADSVGRAGVYMYHWECCSVLHSRIIDTFYGSYGFEVKEDFLLRSIQRYSSPVFHLPVGSFTLCLLLTQTLTVPA